MVFNITLLDTADSTYAISMLVFSHIYIFLSMSNAWYSLIIIIKKPSSEQYASIDLQPHWTKHVVDPTLGQMNPNGYSKLCFTPELTNYASLSSSILIYCWVEWKLWLMGRNHHSAYVDLCVLQCKSLHHCVFSVYTYLIRSGSVHTLCTSSAQYVEFFFFFIKKYCVIVHVCVSPTIFV